MAEYKIVWSTGAKADLFDILDYYIQRNKSAAYSKKLYAEINESIKLISNNPLIGIKTDYNSVRTFITGDYQIIYEIFDQLLLIVMIWDCRQFPGDKRIGKRIK